MVPQLATLRARLSALADTSDPLALQRAVAAAMLSADPAADPVYFVDDHFVPYSGARPVGKGWNTKRRHAQPGRADTLLTGLREVLGPDAPVLLAFDRGGAYPAAFTACRQAGADWVTYRRGALVEVTAPARRSRRGGTGNSSACRWPTRPCRSTVTALPASSPCSRTARRCCRCSPATPPPPARTCCAGCGPDGGSRTCSNTPARTTGSTLSPTI